MEGDAQALRRLFLLLIDNAVKYTPSGGNIEVSQNMGERFATAMVKDTGIGISKVELSHIFERFYRVDQARSREQGGAGLGLAIGRWIAEAHGGMLSMESTPDKGSVCTVRLLVLPGSSDANELRQSDP
ncbi:MAG: hypothetical protein H0W33_07585 [Gammaproteobacteria bacterium]|nr:hypothetical protein [Gammaproteobacteria bacterium]